MFFESLDQGAAHGIVINVQQPWLTPVMVVLTRLGDPRVLLGVVLLGALLLLLRGRVRAAAVVVGTAVAGFALTHAVKAAVDRERFEVRHGAIETPQTKSFPSA